MEINENTFPQIRELVQSGKLVIGVHTAGAANFFDQSATEMERAIGEPASFQRNLVLWSMYASSLLIFSGIFLAIKAFGWWGILAIAGGFALLTFQYTFSQLGMQRIAPTIIFLAISGIVVSVIDQGLWSKLWILSFVLTLFLIKVRFYAAHHFLRSLVVKNYRAFATLNGTLVSIKDGDSTNTKDPSEELHGETTLDKFDRERWFDQLSGLAFELGTDNSELEICAYPEHTYDTKATPLFTTHSTDLDTCISRLRKEFGGGTFWFIIFVNGEVRRRFSLIVSQQNDDQELK